MKIKHLYSLTDFTPKDILTEDIVIQSVESYLAHQRELLELTKDDIGSRIASTLESASLTDWNLMEDEYNMH